MERVLTEDLLVDILQRLPIKSLLCFRCVSKSWYSLISSSRFILAHMNYAKKNSKRHIIFMNYDGVGMEINCKLCQDNDALDEIVSTRFPFETHHNDFVRMQSCVNGVVCFSDDLVKQTNTLILWNPMIRRSLMLPKPNYTSNATSVYGFGYGQIGNDYKAVRVVYPDSQNNPLAEIFRLSKGEAWKRLYVASSLPLIHRRQAYLNGAIHWLVYGNSVLAFDVDAEAFDEMELPEDLKNTVFLENLVIATWKGLLSVFEMTHYLGEIRLWVMEEYGVAGSWRRQMQISSLGVLRSIEGLRRSGEVLWGAIDDRLHWYNPVTAQVFLEVGGLQKYFCIKSDVESLVLLDQPGAMVCCPGLELCRSF